MPIVLDDSILIPPSLRRGPPPRVYHTIPQPGTTTTTIIESDRRPLTPPRSPVIIHQETTSYLPPRDASPVDDYRSQSEYSSRGRVRRYYGGSEPGGSYGSRSIGPYDSVPYPLPEYSRHRANYDDYYDEEDDYYLEDGSRHGYLRSSIYNHRHHGPHVIPGPHGHDDLPGPYESEKHHRRVRHLAQAGLAVGALGAAKALHDHRGRRKSYDGYSSDSPDEHHRGRKLAGAALGATAAGLAAHQLYKRRHRSRSRSVESYTSSDTDHRRHHRGRKLAGAALGATAAGIAAHKLRKHRRQSRSASVESYTSPSDSDHRHRKAKIAAGTAAAIGAGLAARHLRHRHGSRSRPSSRSPSPHRGNMGRHIAAAALGATAAGLAHHHYKHHHEDNYAVRPRPIMRRSYSDGGVRRRHSLFHRNRSTSPSSTRQKIKRGVATAVAAAVAKKAIDHYREKSRVRSRSLSRSLSRHSHHRHHRSLSRSQSRSREVPATMVGGAPVVERPYRDHNERQDVRREEEMQQHGGGIEVPNGPPPMPHNTPIADPLSPPPPLQRNGTNSGSRSRKNSSGTQLVEGLLNHPTGGKEPRRGLGYGLSPESIAHKLGEALSGQNGSRE
ncbi:hypothetical protein BDZ91DRAFT_279878 [Kalaharituber pfeilii]|nr:hypothetical protein BDZ91DRAFT_279878 [Kalaharituber pfeilii]